MYNLLLLYFFNHGFKFQDSVCNDCHQLAILCINRSNISFSTVKGVDYSCFRYGINKSKANSSLKNYVLDNREYI